MARIAGVDLPRDKKIQYALPYIFGIGPSNAKKILAETGVSADARVRDLRDAEVARLRQVRSEEHTSELQSRPHLVCRLLLEKKKTPPWSTARPTPQRCQARHVQRLSTTDA